MLKGGVSLRNLLVLLVTCSGCKTGPIIEHCIFSLEGEPHAVCYDERLEDPAYDKALPELENYIMTNPDDFQTLREACRGE